MQIEIILKSNTLYSHILLDLLLCLYSHEAIQVNQVPIMRDYCGSNFCYFRKMRIWLILRILKITHLMLFS